MAFRVRNTNALSFGVMAAQQTITHVRFRVATGDAQPVVVDIPDVTVNIGENLRLPALSGQVKYNSGDLTDDHMEAAVKDYWENTSFEIDMMTSATVVCADANYSQQSTNAWTFDKPADS